MEGIMRTIICATILALAATAAGAQELTPFQRQVLGGIKKSLVEYLQKQHATCEFHRQGGVRH
jgi:hypothetical protein